MMIPYGSKRVTVYYLNVNNSDKPFVHLYGCQKILFMVRVFWR